MIKTKRKTSKIEIDLTGPQGNAFFLLGTGSKLAKQLGLDWNFISQEMQSGDYDNLIQVFDRHFEAFVTLYR